MDISTYIFDDFITNTEEILEELKKPEINKLFSYRGKNPKRGGVYQFKSLDGKGANMYSLMDMHTPDYLKKLALKTAKFKTKFKPDQVVFNKYPPGGFLGKHKDSAGSYWEFHLIFLQSTKSHFTVYDDNDNPYLIEEKPGRCLDLPLGIIHESTQLDLDEETKYSMVFIWS